MGLLPAADRLSSLRPAQVIPSIGKGYLPTSDTSPLVNTLTLFNQVRARLASLKAGWLGGFAQANPGTWLGSVACCSAQCCLFE